MEEMLEIPDFLRVQTCPAHLAKRRAQQRVYYSDSNLQRPNNRLHWTREEDEIVLEPGSLTDHELAELLGRSTHAVDNRRWFLKRRT